ncbi:MAG: response regulator transcription factor [Pseudomonadota bacterium]
MRILVVDDDPALRQTVMIALERAGFEARTASDGQKGLVAADRDRPDLIVLDVGMPEMDGFEVCRRLRKTSDVPVLFLTARDDEIDRVVGLEIGADDYVTKPFSPRELIARINTILKRTKGAAVKAALSHGDIRLDVGSKRCEVGATEIALTQTEFSILAVLMRRAQQTIARHHLANEIWGAGSAVSGRTLDSHLRNLRTKLANAGAPDSIETVHGMGVRLKKCVPS